MGRKTKRILPNHTLLLAHHYSLTLPSMLDISASKKIAASMHRPLKIDTIADIRSAASRNCSGYFLFLSPRIRAKCLRKSSERACSLRKHREAGDFYLVKVERTRRAVDPPAREYARDASDGGRRFSTYCVSLLRNGCNQSLITLIMESGLK